MVIACVNRAVINKQLTQQEGKDLVDRYNNLVQANIANGSLSPTLAAAQAAQTMAGQLRGNAAIMRLRAANQLRIQAELGAFLANHIGTSDNPKMAKQIVDAIFTTDYADRTKHLSLEGLKYHIDLQAKRHVAEALANLDRKFNGHVDTLQQAQIANELNGISTGNAVAKNYAEGFKKAMDYLTERYRAAGGALGKLADWDIQHIHDRFKVKNAGMSEWVGYTMPMLDRQKMISEVTGLPMSDVELKGMLENVYNTISSNGLNTSTPGFKAKGSIANKWDNERTLHFQPDAWAKYNERFGKSDIITTAEHNMSSMAKSIAQMETFGPNVDVGKDWLKTVVKQELLKQDERARANGDLKRSVLDGVKGIPSELSKFDIEGTHIDKYIDQWFDIANGRTFGDSSSSYSKVFGETRAYLASVQLGSAILNAVGDLGTLAWVSHMNDLPLSKVMGNYLTGLFAGKSKAESRVFAAELGLIVEHLQSNLLQKAHFDMSENHGIAATLSDKVMRWSGLTRHTEAGRIAFGLSLAQEIGKNFGKTFDELDRGLQRGLRINDIKAADWDVIRSSTPIVKDGIPHLNIADVERLDGTAAAKLSQYVQSETDRAVIASGWKFDRFMLDMGFGGEAGRFASMYKRYPVLLMMNHMGRYLFSPEFSGAERAVTLVGFTATMTVLGAVAMTLKDITSGRDPRKWFDKNDKMFWMDAFFVGGAGGIMGDYIKQSVDTIRQGRSMDDLTPMLNATTGPGFALAADLAKLPGSLITNLVHGKSMRESMGAFGSEVANMTKYTPGNSFFMTKAMTDRLFEDQIRKMIDPKADAFFNRQIEARQKNYNSRYYWRPGRTEPDRGPDLNVFDK